MIAIARFKVPTAQAPEFRADIERALGAKIFLGLHIKVSKEWQKDPKLLAKLGFGEKG